VENDRWPEGLVARLGFFAEHFLAIVIDTSFLALWLLLQWLSERAIQYFELADVIDRYVLLVFQVFFAASTLAPVAIYICVDIRVMIIRALQKLRQETGGPRV
jgi:hypothetical protein